jgi:hypothetical protein
MRGEEGKREEGREGTKHEVEKKERAEQEDRTACRNKERREESKPSCSPILAQSRAKILKQLGRRDRDEEKKKKAQQPESSLN